MHRQGRGEASRPREPQRRAAECEVGGPAARLAEELRLGAGGGADGLWGARGEVYRWRRASSRTCLRLVSTCLGTCLVVSRTCLASRLQTAGEEREGGGKQEEDEEVAHAYYVCGSEEREREKNSALFRCRAPRVTGTPQCGSPPACSSAPVLGRTALTTTRSVIAALPSAAARRPARRQASRQSARTRCLRPRTNRSARGRRSCRQEHTSKAARALPKCSVPTASQESEQQPSLSPSGI